MLIMTPKSSVRRIRATDNCFSASRGGVPSRAESWQPAHRFWYTASPETAAEAGAAAQAVRRVNVSRDRFSTRSILYESAAGDLLARHVRLVLLVFVADEFEKIGVKLQIHLLNLARPGLGVGLRIVDGGLHLQRSEVPAV